MKFTKIRKWATAKGFEVKDGGFSEPTIKVIVSKDLYFTLKEKESTVYHSIRGMAGNPKGLYLTNSKQSYAFHKTSQGNAITDMEMAIERNQWVSRGMKS